MCNFFKWKPPYPEEKFDKNATEENTNADDAVLKWLDDYNVPGSENEYWQTQIIIEVDASLPYPAMTWTSGGQRHMKVQPGYLNSGVLAHEQAHNSYFLLTDILKLQLKYYFSAIRNTNDLLKKLSKYKPLLKEDPGEIRSNGVENIVEQHAEIYRYLGPQTPHGMKMYYPRLF